MVLGDKMVEAINSYKIHLNANIGSDINYRNFETLGCGTVLATVAYNFENSVQYAELGFQHGVNCILFHKDMTAEVFIENVNKVLDDDDYRKSIEENALELAKKHTYKERAKTIIELWRKL
jgi:spore maturation protein CgeB